MWLDIERTLALIETAESALEIDRFVDLGIKNRTSDVCFVTEGSLTPGIVRHFLFRSKLDFI